MMLVQVIANDVAVAIDAAGGRVPSCIYMHSKLEKVLRNELNGLRKRVGQEPIPDGGCSYIMGIPVMIYDGAEISPWTIVQ